MVKSMVVTVLTFLAAIFAVITNFMAWQKKGEKFNLLFSGIAVYYAIAYFMVAIGVADSVLIGSAWLRPMTAAFLFSVGCYSIYTSRKK